MYRKSFLKHFYFDSFLRISLSNFLYTFIFPRKEKEQHTKEWFTFLGINIMCVVVKQIQLL